MNEQVKDRLILPFAIPLGALGFIFIVAFSMSRVLLNVPKEIATAVALMTAFNIVAAFSFMAMRPRANVLQLAPMAVVVLLPLLMGSAVAAGIVEVKAKGEGVEKKAQLITLTAVNVAFDKSEFVVPAGQPFKLQLANKDNQPHNIEILKEKGSSEKLFTQPFFVGPKAVTWDVKPIPAGTYYFQCQVHPGQMNGTVRAESASSTSAKTAPAEVTLKAKNLAFDKAEFKLTANTKTKLEFDNEDSQPHNVEILKEKGSSEKLFTQPFFIGPAKKTWEIDPIPAGTYFFQCQVHPAQMFGKVTVT